MAKNFKPKIAIVADWLTTYGGAEKVVKTATVPVMTIRPQE